MSDRWPRAMKPRTAARYFDVSLAEFYRIAKLPKFPKSRPLKTGGVGRYDREELDSWWVACAKIVAREEGEEGETGEVAQAQAEAREARAAEEVGRKAARDLLRRGA